MQILWTLIKIWWPYVLGLLFIVFIIWFYNHEIDTSYQNGYETGVAWQKQEQANADLKLKNSRDAEKEVLENEAQARINSANIAADSAQRNANSLFKQLEQIKQRIGNDSGVDTSGKTAAEAVNLLTDLFRESVERGNKLAEYADKAGNAGLTCERSYDSLRDNNG